jgi:hypothetical protein
MGKHHKPHSFEVAKLELQIHELSNKIEERKAKKELAALRARMADHFYANSEPINLRLVGELLDDNGKVVGRAYDL